MKEEEVEVEEEEKKEEVVVVRHAGGRRGLKEGVRAGGGVCWPLIPLARSDASTHTGGGGSSRGLTWTPHSCRNSHAPRRCVRRRVDVITSD
ncbi:hypothetical protein E2C01_068817 [Portunus trituberculatus]|uniref:Uncharacterized protein n=1 Tax=Portunus trituberculatus TaxID=210409 RepID=A0A5B7I0J1_PORTR|nr:hypothetical protein [Portunus trituberculatus]